MTSPMTVTVTPAGIAIALMETTTRAVVIPKETAMMAAMKVRSGKKSQVTRKLDPSPNARVN